MSALRAETVLDVEHWTENLFSFKTTRSPSFRFDSGQFVMIGLEIDGKPLLRAYSMAGSAYDDTLSFFSIKVANGPLTSKLQNIKVGSRRVHGALDRHVAVQRCGDTTVGVAEVIHREDRQGL